MGKYMPNSESNMYTEENINNLPIKVAAMYKFASLDDIETKRETIYNKFMELGIRGILLIAHEGINGTISGTPENLEAAIAFVGNVTGINEVPRKYSWAAKHPFLRTRVRLKKEIVTIGDETVDPNKMVGTYVKPEDWNAIISDPDVVVIDTRNDYEYEIGTFKGAIDPKTKTFREFPKYVRENYDPKTTKKVAMFCTGGIRCEKASSFMLKEGFETVYHLDGGILKYLETVPQEESLWQGECFVFDNRVAVGHGVTLTDTILCHACRAPLLPEDREHPHYEEGISCPKCHDTQTEANRERARERQKQITLAKARGINHLGRRPDGYKGA